MSEEVINEMHRVLEMQKKLNISEGAPDVNLRKDRLDRVIAMVNKYQDQIVLIKQTSWPYLFRLLF
jgi:hypothetical protein